MDNTETTINFQSQLFDLKEDFYKASMDTPLSLQQELLIMEILREDLYDIADALDVYIDTKKIIYPIANVINVYKDHSKNLTNDVEKYSKEKQTLINEFMENLRDLIENDGAEDELKKYYVDQVFRVYVFNLETIPGAYNDGGI